jgi:hypothetical protein
MMHNPFQSYQIDPTLGAYAGMTTPFSSPYTALQTSSMNPATAMNPLAATLGLPLPTAGIPQLGQTGYAGIPNYGSIHPQQLQLASLLASQAAIPQLLGLVPHQATNWQNPYQAPAFQSPWITAGLQNPLLTAGLQNPLFTVGLHNPLLNPILAQQLLGPQFGLQPYSPYQQIGPFGSPFGQQGSPYQQVSPFGQQVSPFGQQGSPYQQVSPLGQQASPFGQQGLPFGQQPGLPYTQQPGLPYGQQQGLPYGQQQGLPYGQIGSPLAPQSWVGQSGQFGGGQPFGQIHPLLAQQLGARAFHTPGIAPWAGF